MDILSIQPIINEPALFIHDKKILVIADLHIGIENELKEHGINTQSKTGEMIDHLEAICEKYKPKEIILLGDIKHNIPSSTIWERKDVKKFLEIIQQYGDIHIIPGNHDGNINKLTTEKNIVHPSDGLIIENIGFIHGHKWPDEHLMESEMLVMAHTHPAIMFVDRREYRSFEPCWLKTNFNKNNFKKKYPKSKPPELLIIPAFNPFCGGIAANVDGIAGPLGKIIDVNNSEVFLLDGVSIGKIKDLK